MEKAPAPAQEVWLRGAIDGIDPMLMPVAHALIQAREDVEQLAAQTAAQHVWERPGGAASVGFHVRPLGGALDRLFTYARGEALTDTQKAELRAESQPHPEIDATALIATLDAAIARAMVHLRHTDEARVYDERKVGRAGLPSSVLGLLFHAAEHTSRHAGQLVTTVQLSHK